MSYIKKLILFVVSPPGTILLMTIIAVLVSISKRVAPKFKKITIWTCLIFIYFSSTSFITSPILNLIENKKSLKEQACTSYNYEAVAVLSAGLENGRYIDTNSKINSSSFKRTIKGVELALKTKALLIILGGITKKNQVAESNFLGGISTELGIKKDKLIMEQNSRNSIENVMELKKIITQKNIIKVAVVTSASHGLRVEKLLNKQNINHCLALTDYKAKKELILSDLVPSVRNMEINSTLIYEILAIIKYSVVRAI